MQCHATELILCPPESYRVVKARWGAAQAGAVLIGRAR